MSIELDPCCCDPACDASTFCSGGSLPVSADVELQDNSPATVTLGVFSLIPTDCTTALSAAFSTGPLPGTVAECVSGTTSADYVSTCVATYVFGTLADPTGDTPYCTSCATEYDDDGNPTGGTGDRYVAAQVALYRKLDGHLWAFGYLVESWIGTNMSGSRQAFGQVDLGMGPIDCCTAVPFDIPLTCLDPATPAPGAANVYGCIENGAGKLVVTLVCAP